MFLLPQHRLRAREILARVKNMQHADDRIARNYMSNTAIDVIILVRSNILSV